MAIRIVLVDDHTLIRRGLANAFEQDPSIEVVGEAASRAEAAMLVATSRPDTVLLDVNLPDGDGISFAAELRREHPRLGIVVLTMHGDDEHLFRALEAGASAFVLKTAPSEEVLAAVRHAVMAPTSFTAADLPAALRRRMSPDRTLLTPRETEVLQLLGEGLPVASVARRLYIGESTAKSHISKLYAKLGATNRTQAVMTALRLGLLSRDDTTSQNGRESLATRHRAP